MGFGRRDLVFWSLCVLDEALDAARAGPVKPSPALRLALAFLYVAGDRREEWFDREPYDRFWRAAIEPAPSEIGAASFGRSQEMTAAFNAIARAAGMERDVPLIAAMRKARTPS